MAGPPMLTLDIYSVVLCKQCNTILAEGRNACECNDLLNVMAFISATKEVEVEETMRYDISPDLQGCVYSYLKCKVCTAKVGMFLYCAVEEVAHLRKLFCFFRKSILCYSMKTKELNEGNRFHFNITRCLTHLRKLEQETYSLYKRVQEFAGKVQHRLQPPLAED